jgi:GMC oxidoreductase
MAVVDINTKFFGTDNLFVVDASIRPDLVSPDLLNALEDLLIEKLPTGNTQAILW